METKKIVMGVISVAVAIIVLMSMIPIFTDAGKSEDTFDNSDSAFYFMKELESGDSWTRTNGVWAYNGETLTNSSNDNVSIVVTENTVFRQSGQVRGTTYGGNTINTVDVVTVDTTDVIKLNTNTTINYTVGYGAVTEGDLILKNYTDKAYVHGDTPIWVTGVTGLPQTSSLGNLVCHVEGTIDDGFTITVDPVSNGAASNIVVGDYTVNYSEVNGYKDLYLIENIQFGITADYTDSDVTTSKSTTATYSTFILPKEVTAERSAHASPVEATLIGLIPLLMMVGIMLTAVGLFIAKYRKN